ncbi:putative nuclease HARBI1 [Salvia divinorum]|uniref:Nuclease HARBI1 n=1 Tax=Salvia divinorum TaxID=28513 RepID=A0ABD1HTZ5_SALDI
MVVDPLEELIYGWNGTSGVDEETNEATFVDFVEETNYWNMFWDQLSSTMWNECGMSTLWMDHELITSEFSESGLSRKCVASLDDMCTLFQFVDGCLPVLVTSRVLFHC